MIATTTEPRNHSRDRISRRNLLRGSLAAAALLAVRPHRPAAAPGLPAETVTAFFRAVRTGDTEAVSALLGRERLLLGALDAADRSGFAVALLERREAVAELLRERGYAPDLHESALALDWERLAELAESDPEAVHRDHPIGGTAMYAAALGGAAESIWRVYAQTGEPNAVPGDAGEPPLLAALRHPDLATAERTAATLLANGADSAATGPDGVSPLHRAGGRGSYDLVEMLIRKGAPAGARDAAGRTSRELAERAGHRRVAALLASHHVVPRDRSTSRRAYDVSGRPYRPPAMDGVAVRDRVDAVGVTHFDLDELRRRVEATPELAHAVATTTEGAVEAGAHMGRHDVVDFLLERGAPYSLPTAVMRGDATRVRELLAEDPLRIHERGPHDFPLLWYPVIGGGSVEMAELLLTAGAGLEWQHFLGTTALHYAARAGQLEMVAFLLESGADPRRVGKKFNPEGDTPMELAEAAGHEEVAKLLRAHPAPADAEPGRSERVDC